MSRNLGHSTFVLIAGLSACQRSEFGKLESAQADSVAPGATTSANVLDSAGNSKLNDWLIAPGIRVGAVNARSSEADLKVTFGAADVIRDSVYWFEGQYRPATVVFRRDSIRRIAIVWKDDAWSRPERIEIEGNESLWHTAEGITLGTTAEDLERLNGKPFRITSIDHDYAGLAWSWESGALQEKLKRLELWLDPRFASDEHHPLSSDGTARVARPTVVLMYAYFPD